MASLGNTIINGALRVNGKINTSDVISAPSFTGALTGNADTATKLKTARTINGVNFDGTANITVADSTKLPLAGGTITGNISYNMNGSTQIPFKVYGGDANGQGVSVGAGGATIIGSGESAKACESLLTATTEETWITSDGAIKFYTNCNTIENKVGVFLNNSRAFYPDTDGTGSLGTSTNKWNNIYSNNLTIQNKTSATVTYADKQNPRINFSNVNGDQAVSLIFTDYDTYKSPYGLTLIGNGQSTTNGGAYLKVEGNVQASTMTASTFTGNLNGNASSVGGKTMDLSTTNTTDTWIPVVSGNKLQHTQRVFATGKTHTNHNTEQDRIPTLSFLSFWNGAYNSSNNSNLTYAHQGIIQCKPTTLYSNASGTTGTIKLSQTAANFSYLEIFYCDNNNREHHSIKISEPNNKLTSLDTGESYENDKNLYFRTTSYTISGTSMTVKSYGYMNFWQVSGSDRCGVNPEKSNYIKIIKVLGYK